MENADNIMLLLGSIGGIITGGILFICSFPVMLNRINTYREITLNKKIDLQDNIIQDNSISIDLKELLNAEINDVVLIRDKKREYHFENYFFWINKILILIAAISLIPTVIITFYICTLFYNIEINSIYLSSSIVGFIFIYLLHFSIGIHRKLITTEGTIVDKFLGKPKT